jgi:hypothetical protein
MKTRLEFVRALGELSIEIALTNLPSHLDNIAASLYGGQPVPTPPIEASYLSLACRMEIIARLAQFITDWEGDTPNRPALERIEDILGQIIDPRSLPKHLLRDTAPDRTGLTREERDILRDPEKKIPVIKLVRERTGLGLKEAKDLVDDYIYQSKSAS